MSGALKLEIRVKLHEQCTWLADESLAGHVLTN